MNRIIASMSPYALNEEQKQIVNGIVLSSDTNIAKDGTVEVNNSSKQYSYIHWLHHKLSTISSELDNFRFYLNSSEYLRSLYKQIYPNGVKTVNTEFLNRLTPLSLSIWFSNDCYLNNENYILYAHGFSVESNKLIKNYFFDKWGITTELKGFVHWFDKENSVKFCNIIKYYIIPYFLYKLVSSERKHVVYLAGAMQYAPDGGIPWRRNLRKSLNKKGYYCIDPTKEENRLNLDENWQSFINTDFAKFQKNARVIIDNDIYYVNMAETVVCMYDEFIGGGSFHEIGECYLRNKTLYLLNLSDKPLYELSHWALGCCTKVFNSTEELLDFMPDVVK